MPRLTNYAFVEIFDEEKRAGEMVLTEPVGMFEIGEKMPVLSKVTGLYCAELLVLLVDCRVGRYNNNGDFVDVKSDVIARVDAHRNMSVTASVRDLPTYADDWHNHVSAQVSAHDDTAKYVAAFKAEVNALAPQGVELDTVTISSHGTDNDKKVVLKAKKGA